VRQSDRAPGLWVADDVVIAPSATIGIGVVLHPGTVIEDGVTVQDGAVIGKEVVPAAAHPHPGARIEAGALIGTQAVIFRGARIRRGVRIRDQAHVREGTSIGPGTNVGRGSAVGAGVTIGARCNIQTNVWITSHSTLEDDVFVGPGAVCLNDPTMARMPAGLELRGPVLRRACRVGGGALLAPGVEIGEEAFVCAGAVVTRDVEPRAVVRGVPAGAAGQVRDEELLERFRGK
jgi:UDP-2-acetamido-3-amino-2,3-dideoxy-glucuronate N-acetyltransferase